MKELVARWGLIVGKGGGGGDVPGGRTCEMLKEGTNCQFSS